MAGLVLQEAMEILLSRTKKIQEKEMISLWEAPGRVLAEDVYAMHSQPPFDRSPLDGYAVRSEDIKDASQINPVKLKVLCEVDAGHVSEEKVREGTAIRIMTGAPIPDGADCVIRQEDTDYGEDIVEIYESVGSYENYCFQGEDYKEGTLMMAEGTELTAIETGILASLGRDCICVYRRPRAAVLTTGDEITLPGEPLAAGKIYDSNMYTVATRLMLLGIEVVSKERLKDEPEQAAEHIRRIIQDVDIIVTTGGVSVGKKDIMHDVIRLLSCERLFWRIDMKPGMPTLCAQHEDKLLICLSGNPFGAAANVELIVRPVLAKLSGRKSLIPKKVKAISQSTFPKRSEVTRYVRALYEDGKVRIPNGSNDSGVLSTMRGCNCMIELPAGLPELKEGDEICVVLL